jgi:hypothetical protein
MQLPPNVEYWLRVAAIVVPATSTIVVALVTYLFGRSMANRQKELNKDLENHKRDISKELENHRFHLQSDFQVRLHQFQTRFSWLHQRRAEAIEKLFELAARVQNDLYIWARWGNRPRKETIQEFLAITQEHFQNLIDFHDERRIYFDEETQKVVLIFVEVTRSILDSHESIEDNKDRVPELTNWMKNNAISLIHETIRPLMDGLEDKLKELLSAETPSHNLSHPRSSDGGLDGKS